MIWSKQSQLSSKHLPYSNPLATGLAALSDTDGESWRQKAAKLWGRPEQEGTGAREPETNETGPVFTGPVSFYVLRHHNVEPARLNLRLVQGVVVIIEMVVVGQDTACIRPDADRYSERLNVSPLTQHIVSLMGMHIVCHVPTL